ncbi:MAG: TRAP transporter substrate-binding protein DctP [Melioribacteraceae bacterium]|nr:TRAP transporter substrate-binding protein DctP [Melioribacteraceae bacterium]
MKKLNRKDFIKKSSVVAAAVGTGTLLSSCGKAGESGSPAIHTSKNYEWKMVTTWPPHFPIVGDGADRLAKNIETMSEGQMKIQVYGGGELIPPFETFDAVSQGIVQMGHATPYYWAGKAPASQFFSSIPFGMNTQQTNAWLYNGGGLELWRELYSDFNLVPFPGGNTGGQMGGWFNKKINSVSDLKGLKMRMPGIGGKVITEAGGSAILSPGGEIYTNLERGVIDATEWIGPYHDYLMGFNRIAKYYYFPGWHEPTGVLELMVNKSAYEELPNHLKEIIKSASNTSNIEMLTEFETKNFEYLEKLKNEEQVDILKFPDEVLNKLEKITKEVIQEIVLKDSMSKKVYDSYSKFQKNISSWTDISDWKFD